MISFDCVRDLLIVQLFVNTYRNLQKILGFGFSGVIYSTASSYVRMSDDALHHSLAPSSSIVFQWRRDAETSGGLTIFPPAGHWDSLSLKLLLLLLAR